jgi:ATP-binding cassette, subfamily B, bacterial
MASPSGKSGELVARVYAGRATVRTQTAGDVRLMIRLLRRVRPFGPHIGGVFLLGLLATPLALLSPVPLKLVVDSVIGNRPLPGILAAVVPAGAGPEELLLLAVAMLAAIAVLTQLQELAADLLQTWTGERLVLDLRAELFRHVQRLSFAWSDTRGTADSVYRIQYDAQSIQYVAVDGVIPFVTAAVTVGAMIYVAAQIDLALALVALGICPLLLIAIGAMRQRLRRGSRELKKLESGSLSVLQEVLSAIRVVKAFGQEDRERDRFVDGSSSTLSRRLRLVLAEGGFGLVIGLITAGGTAAVLYVGVTHVRAGLITLGELLLVLGYLAQLYSPLTTISRKAARFQNYLASAERAFALLDELPEVEDRPGARPLDRAAGAVEFDHVAFAYEQGGTIFRDVRLVVPAGTRVGIRGASGAGKTTLVSLLSRFYDPTEGRILLDGVDMADYVLADLRNQFAIVLQEPLLFSTTIAENIAYGRPGATHAEIIRAADAAGAASFISRLPNGYDTPVGERGMRLSGGERQRIALARAYLKNAPILILDEPTSSVDVKTEAAILETLDVLMRGRTTFMIAHRASTLALCDVLVRIDRDHVVSVTRRDGRSVARKAATR